MNNKRLIEKIEESLNEVRPYLRKDGGDVEFVELTDSMVVKVKLLGACKECNLSLMTMKAGIEATIKKNVSEVTSVISV